MVFANITCMARNINELPHDIQEAPFFARSWISYKNNNFTTYLLLNS